MNKAFKKKSSLTALINNEIKEINMQRECIFEGKRNDSSSPLCIAFILLGTNTLKSPNLDGRFELKAKLKNKKHTIMTSAMIAKTFFGKS